MMTDFAQFPCRNFTVESQALAHRTLSVANCIFEIALKAGILEVPDRRACVLALRHEKASTALFVGKVGDTFPSEDFRVNCFAFAPEKVDRALMHCHVSSYITRDEIKRWGGGIILTINNLIRWGIGISGLKEWEDEGVGIVTGMYTFGLPVTQEMSEIITISKNVFVGDLVRLVERQIGSSC